MPLFLCLKELVCTVLCLQGHFSLPSGANGRGLEVCIVRQHFGYGRRPSQFNIIFLKFMSAENDAKLLMFALFDCFLE
jgi:hypothetical protein